MVEDILDINKMTVWERKDFTYAGMRNTDKLVITKNIYMYIVCQIPTCKGLHNTLNVFKLPNA